MSIKEKSIVFPNSNGKKLWGVLSVPNVKKKIPVVLIAHGFNGTKSARKFVELSRKFAKNGIGVFRFDFNGSGDSEGEFYKLKIAQWKNDLESAFKIILNQKRIDKKRIGIFGHSLGSLIACLLQTKINIAKGLVLVAPALNQKSLIKDWYTSSEIKKWKKNGFVDKSDFRIGVQYLYDAKDYTPLANKINVPTLIIQGMKDKVVLPKYSKELFKKFTGKKKLILVKNADHDFEGFEAKKELIKHSLNWFKNNL